MYDVIIIGGGPAGMTAALYSLRESFKVLVIEKESFGGQISKSPILENYPSISKISGLEFSDNLLDQITNLGAEFDVDEVVDIKQQNDIFIVKTVYSEYKAKYVIIATGVTHKKLEALNYQKFEGNGLSYCATCDGPLFKDKNVVVIGDANSALQYALLLSKYANSVMICTLFDHFFADPILINRIKETSNISYKHNLSLLEYKGELNLSSLSFKDTLTNEIVEINCDGCFVAIGQEPHNEIFKNLVDLENGFIVVNDDMETKTPNLFAVGDCRNKKVRQVVTAISDAAIASVTISKK